MADAAQIAALAERFWSKVERGADAECWLWTAYVGNHGYSEFGVGRRAIRSHRVAYELVKGPIPEGHQIDHLCRNRRCVNPNHLEAVTPQENTRRGDAGLHRRREAAAITHCPHGHPYTPENTYVCKAGKRSCRECKRERDRKRDRRRAA